MGLPSDVCAPKCSFWHCASPERGLIGAAQSINCHQLNPATPSALDVAIIIFAHVAYCDSVRLYVLAPVSHIIKGNAGGATAFTLRTYARKAPGSFVRLGASLT